MQKYVQFHFFFLVSLNANGTDIYSGFPEGKYQIKLTDSSFFIWKLNLAFDHQIGKIPEETAYINMSGTTYPTNVNINGFHDCEHAYFTVSKGNAFSWVCSAFGTGSPMIDELTATCTDPSGNTKVHHAKLTPV